MPILRTPQRATVQRRRVNTTPRRLEFASINGGRVFTFDANVEIMSDIQGLEVPPRELRMSGGGGGLPRLDHIRDLPAETSLVLLCRGERGVIRNDLEALRSFLNYRSVDYRTHDGTFDLVAVDEVGRTFKRRCAYKSGLEGDYGGDFLITGVERLTRGLVLTSVWPYWAGEDWSTGEVRLPKPLPWLSSVGASLFGSQKLAPSLVLGASMPVRVGGTVDSPGVIELHGPITSAHIFEGVDQSNPRRPRLDFTVKALGASDYLFIDTGRNRRMELNGGGVNSGAGLIGRGAQWAPLAPGVSNVTFDLVGADEPTFAIVRGQSLHETPWPGDAA